MVAKVQVDNINFKSYKCIINKYDRVVGNVNHGRSVYYDSKNNVYYKLFHPDYCRINNFRKAFKLNFFKGLAPALTGLIYDNNNIVGYITKAGKLLSSDPGAFNLIPKDFFHILKNRIKESGMFFYDLVPHNIVIVDGKPSLIDLESVYDLEDYKDIYKEKASVKPEELDSYIKELWSSKYMKISFIQPGRNNLKYLKWSYNSIRKNQGSHEVEICVADDFSSDGTWEWCQEVSKKDPYFKAIRNGGPVRVGHTILYDLLVNTVATNDICMIYHADMYLCPNALDHVKELIKPKTIVSLTRVEPPLHPPGPEKIIKDFGIEPEEFKEDELLEWMKSSPLLEKEKVTEGIFAPWAFYKKDFQEIGGHDAIFAPQSKEDTDIFNRFQLNGVKFKQTWEGVVYHMTCRGSRFADGAKRNPDGEVFMKNRETDEWLAQNQKSTREFIRKWGHFCKHDELMKPIIPPKYNIGFVVTNCTMQLIGALEPWCSNIYCNTEDDVNIRVPEYIDREDTSFDLNKKFKPLDNEKQNDILIQIDGNKFTQLDFDHIQNISEILASDDDIEAGNFELGNLIVDIVQINTYEKELILCKK